MTKYALWVLVVAFFDRVVHPHGVNNRDAALGEVGINFQHMANVGY